MRDGSCSSQPWRKEIRFHPFPSTFPVMSAVVLPPSTFTCGGCVAQVFQIDAGLKENSLKREVFTTLSTWNDFYRGWLGVAHQLSQRCALTVHVIETIDRNFINTNVHKAEKRENDFFFFFVRRGGWAISSVCLSISPSPLQACFCFAFCFLPSLAGWGVFCPSSVISRGNSFTCLSISYLSAAEQRSGSEICLWSWNSILVNSTLFI